MTCDGARDARIWGEAKTSIRNKADMTERLGPGRGFTDKLDFLIASTFLPSVPETRIEGQILPSIPGLGKQVVFYTLFLEF